MAEVGGLLKKNNVGSIIVCQDLVVVEEAREMQVLVVEVLQVQVI